MICNASGVFHNGSNISAKNDVKGEIKPDVHSSSVSMVKQNFTFLPRIKLLGSRRKSKLPPRT